MNWDNLRVFLAVARQGSAMEAAVTLDLDQSTITRRLKQLEQDIGTQLFDRSPQGHRLTAMGQRLLESVQRIEDTLALADADIGGDSHALHGHVRLGATEGFGSYFLAPQLADFCERHPAISVDLLAVPRFVNLSKREADLAISIERPRQGAYVACKLTDYRLALYATPAYLARHAPIRQLADLQQHRLIAYVDELAFSAELRYLAKLAPAAATPLRSTSIVAQLHAARRGHGLAVLPCFMASGCADLQPVLAGQASILRSFWLYAPKEQRDIARVNALWKFLREVVGESQGLLMGSL
ncbi:LysR family transcriptional regulator [Roseateles oligotrophus]|nr:LysR family transcriptional regulator [Roseateles oligotrophus]